METFLIDNKPNYYAYVDFIKGLPDIDTYKVSAVKSSYSLSWEEQQEGLVDVTYWFDRPGESFGIQWIGDGNTKSRLRILENIPNVGLQPIGIIRARINAAGDRYFKIGSLTRALNEFFG